MPTWRRRWRCSTCAQNGNRTDLAFLSEGWLAADRPAVQSEDIVAPGSTGTFTFQVKGTITGAFLLPLRGVVDGGAWMDDLGVYTVITVQ